jgi:hypothetical protein
VSFEVVGKKVIKSKTTVFDMFKGKQHISTCDGEVFCYS